MTVDGALACGFWWAANGKKCGKCGLLTVGFGLRGSCPSHGDLVILQIRMEDVANLIRGCRAELVDAEFRLVGADPSDRCV
jgi:hypothetical protein